MKPIIRPIKKLAHWILQKEINAYHARMQKRIDDLEDFIVDGENKDNMRIGITALYNVAERRGEKVKYKSGKAKKISNYPAWGVPIQLYIK